MIRRLTSHHVATRGPPDRHRIEGLEMHQMAAIVRNHDLRIAIRRCRDVVEELRDRAAIAARSSRDRGAIEPRSHIFRRGIDPIGSEGGQPISRITIDARSWCDRGKNWRLFDRGIEAASSPSGTAPTTLANCLHDRSNDP